MTVPDYTVKVRKWFCVMCDENYEGKSAARVVVPGYTAGRGQEGNWKDRN